MVDFVARSGEVPPNVVEKIRVYYRFKSQETAEAEKGGTRIT